MEIEKEGKPLFLEKTNTRRKAKQEGEKGEKTKGQEVK